MSVQRTFCLYTLSWSFSFMAKSSSANFRAQVKAYLGLEPKYKLLLINRSRSTWLHRGVSACTRDPWHTHSSASQVTNIVHSTKSLGPIRKGKAQLNYFNYSSLRSFRRSAQQMLQSPSSLLLQGLQTFKSQAHPSLAAGTHEAPFRFALFLYACASVCGAQLLSIHLEMATRYNLRQRPVQDQARVTADSWGP